MSARWIPSSRVDSAAMLSAYFEYRQKNPLLAFDPPLTIVYHRSDFPLPILGDLRSYPCQISGCHRCATQQAGFVFRWAHGPWLDTYSRMARDTTWQPGCLSSETNVSCVKKAAPFIPPTPQTVFPKAVFQKRFSETVFQKWFSKNNFPKAVFQKRLSISG